VTSDDHLPADGQQCDVCHGDDHVWCEPLAGEFEAAMLMFAMYNTVAQPEAAA
jgi:hypothetical protein